MAVGLRPQDAGFGFELTAEEWDSLIRGPLIASSAVLSLEGVNVHEISGPLHLPTMDVPLDASTAFLAAGAEITPTQATTDEVVLMARGLKALKCIVLISNESIRSEAGSALGAAQTIISERLKQIVDVALLTGDSGAGITGFSHLPERPSTRATLASIRSTRVDSTCSLTRSSRISMRQPTPTRGSSTHRRLAR